MTQSARVVIAGIGNDMRHDDGAGALVAARALEVLGPAAGPGKEIDGALSSELREPLDLLGNWDEADLAIVIDAVRSRPSGNRALRRRTRSGSKCPVLHGNAPRR